RLELGAALADALERDLCGHVEEQGQVRLAGVPVRRLDEVVRYRRTLVCERAEDVAVEDHVLATREARLDLRVEVIETIGGEEQRHHALVHHAELSVRLRRRRPAREDLADEQPDGTFTRLVREVHEASAPPKTLREELRLRRRPRAVEALEDDEPAGLRGHGRAPGGSMPSRARSSRSRRKLSSSARRSARARRKERTESTSSSTSTIASAKKKNGSRAESQASFAQIPVSTSQQNAATPARAKRSTDRRSRATVCSRFSSASSSSLPWRWIIGESLSRADWGKSMNAGVDARPHVNDRAVAEALHIPRIGCPAERARGRRGTGRCHPCAVSPVPRRRSAGAGGRTRRRPRTATPHRTTDKWCRSREPLRVRGRRARVRSRARARPVPS